MEEEERFDFLFCYGRGRQQGLPWFSGLQNYIYIYK